MMGLFVVALPITVIGSNFAKNWREDEEQSDDKNTDTADEGEKQPREYSEAGTAKV